MRLEETPLYAGILSSLGILLACCLTFQESVDDSAPASNFRGIVDELVAPLCSGAMPVPGLVVGVVRGELKEVYGYGETGLRPDDTPDGDTIFEIASVTKPLTALLLARFVARGDLTLDDAVAPCSPPATSSLCFEGKPVTFLHLATHTSGLPLLPANIQNRGDGYSAEDFHQFLADYSLCREPGSRFEYSTAGYALLGMLLGKEGTAAGFEENLAKEVLEPLGMKSTCFEVTEKAKSRYAVGHAEGAVIRHRKDRGVFCSSGGLKSTANDLLRLISANLRPEAHPHLAEAVALTQKAFPAIPTFPPSIAAIGWHVLKPAGFYWHSGVGSGFRAFIAFDPVNGCGVVILTNTGLPITDARVELAGFGILGALGGCPRIASAAAGCKCRGLRWQAQNLLNVVTTTPSSILALPPCPQHFRSASRRAYSWTAS
ncbi:MAG: beta-lactamase family protein [Planctomycetes bacterium]|nr:beta-lactamase family protein [Planctomycetota bacterium]